MILGWVQEACGPIANPFQKNRGAMKIRVFPNTTMKQSRILIFRRPDDPVALEVGGISLNARPRSIRREYKRNRCIGAQRICALPWHRKSVNDLELLRKIGHSFLRERGPDDVVGQVFQRILFFWDEFGGRGRAENQNASRISAD